MREVYWGNLPTKDGVGRNTGRKVVDWDNSIGRKIKFTYDNINGELEILGYQRKGQYLTIKYINEKFKIKTSNLQRGSIGGILNKYSKDFKIEIATQFKDDKRDLVITDREYRDRQLKPDKKGRVYVKNEKWYKYKCGKCSYVGWMEEGSLLNQKCGCSCCRGLTAVLGINTIWDTDRYLVDLGLSESDAKKYTSGSNHRVIVKCPNCGKEKEKTISDLHITKSIGCNCGDGISYPEKFMAEVLNQLNIDYMCQLSKSTFEWCDKYRYDFYLPDYNIVIETHGEQHYKDCKWTKVKDVQGNDKTKKKLALGNEIKDNNYIVVDCRISDMEYIKNKILRSKLGNIFDLSQIDWCTCEEFALNSMVRDICEHWRNKKEDETPKDLAKVFKISDVTVRKYLNKGAKIWSWCNYDGKKEMRKSGRIISQLQCKEINIFKKDTYLGTFKSCTELSEKSESVFGVKLNIGNISQVCTGKRKSHKGFIFKYIDESQQIAC